MLRRPPSSFPRGRSPFGPGGRGQLRHALILLALVTIIGSCGFTLIEGWSFARSLYFTLITITTVGYGDEGISDAGRQFALVLLLGGIGVASYSFGIVVQAAVARQLAWKDRMLASIQRLSDHVIVCGYGRMGRSVARRLHERGVRLVVIERSESVFERAVEDGFLAVLGSASEDEVLQQAGIERASVFVSVVDSEGENVVITLSARDLCPQLPIIARAEGPEEVRKLRRAGASRTVSPYQSGGRDIVNAITQPKVADFLARTFHAESDIGLAEVRIEPGSPLADQSLAEFGKNEGRGLSFVVLERPGEAVRLPPRGSDVLQEGDLLIVAGDPESIAQTAQLARAGSRVPG